MVISSGTLVGISVSFSFGGGGMSLSEFFGLYSFSVIFTAFSAIFFLFFSGTVFGLTKNICHNRKTNIDNTMAATSLTCSIIFSYSDRQRLKNIGTVNVSFFGDNVAGNESEELIIREVSIQMLFLERHDVALIIRF
jgi:uncharacterized membrane protein